MNAFTLSPHNILQELMINHDNKLCLTALKDLYQEWEQAVEEKMVMLTCT
jgi:hypothetical protein